VFSLFIIIFKIWKSVKRTYLGLNVIVSGIGLVDATPSGGDTVNTSSTDRAKKRSGPIIKKIKKSYKRTPSSDELTGDLMPNKVETGSAKVNLYVYYFTCESM